MNLFITGGTGFLGREVLVRLLKKNTYDNIHLLIRSTHKQTARERLDELLDKIVDGGVREKAGKVCHAVTGDLTLPGLGLSAIEREKMIHNVGQILHVGASTDFSAPLDQSRLFNVEGTRNVLELAKLCQSNGSLKRFDYISTAFVAGTKKGKVTEADLDRGQEFANNYERTKFEAEILVNDYKKHLPICIIRPSIVVGNSKTGYTPHFKVLYWPLKILSKNILPFIPLSRKALLDVVTVDYVADGMICLMEREESIGETFYLTAGIGNEVSAAKVMKDAFKFAGFKKVPRVPIWFLDVMRATPLKKLFPDEGWDIVDLAVTYTAYFAGKGVLFDSPKTQKVLAAHGISPMRWSDYSETILSFCEKSRWGRKLPQKEVEYYKEALS